MYDKEYREVMGAPSIMNKTMSKDQMKKKVLNSIKQIDVSCRISDKELDSKKAALKLNNATHKKLPSRKLSIPKENNKRGSVDKKSKK